jgi:hypothetical protein
MKPYIKPPEPNWTPGEQLRFLAELLRAAKLQAGTLQYRQGLKPSVLQKINLVVKKLDYCEKELTVGYIKAGQEADAEDYFDNQGAILWECANEVRKQPDRRNALALLNSLTAGSVIAAETGLPVGQRPMRKARRLKQAA